jgi:hypothetical protein
MASACAIDDDSKMRFGATQTNPRHGQQLQTRVYGHAHYEKGVSHPTLKVILFIPKVRVRQALWRAIRYRDRSLRTLIPCISEVVQDPQHIVNVQVRATRAWVRDEDYIKCDTRIEHCILLFFDQNKSAVRCLG